MKPIVWLALGYHLPNNPSKNRVYVWRKLKECGAGYFKQGVAILPKNPQSVNQFRNLAGKIRDMGGDATLAELRFLDHDDEQLTVRRFREQSRGEYQELIRDCAKLLENIRQNLAGGSPADSIRRMLRRYTGVKNRDYFMSGAYTDAEDLLDELAGDILHSASELSRQLKAFLE